MDQEMRFHLEKHTEDLIRSGMSRREAERLSRIEFGGVEVAQEQCRQAKGVQRFDDLRQDIGYSIRMLRKNPGFTLVAIITIALGIGVNSTVFSVLNSVILKPLAFNEPERIMNIGEVNPTHGSAVPLFSPANYLELVKQQKSFEAVSTYFYLTVKYRKTNDQNEVWQAFSVDGGFFPALGVKPILGRTFVAADMEPNAPPTAILSYGLWQRKFGGDPHIIGQTLSLSKQPTTVIGVMPESFHSPTGYDYAELWIPLSINNTQFQDRSDRYTRVIGRLKPGTTRAQAQNEMNVIAARLAQDYPTTNKGWSIVVTDLAEVVTGPDVRYALLIVFAAGCCVLLVACANVANLLLARASARRREIGIRSALGATRGRIVRQVLTESVILTLAGGAIGVITTYWIIKAVREFKPVNLPRVAELGIDWRVLLFTLSASILAGCVCGIISGLLSTKSDVVTALKDGGSQTSGGRRHARARNFLIVAELSLSLVLLVCAGLLARSFYMLTHQDLGFNSHNVFSANAFPPSQRSWSDMVGFYDKYIERIRQIPGIESAALVTSPPLVGNPISFPFSVKGESLDPSDKVRTDTDSISTDFLKTLNIPLKAGRDIAETDKLNTPKVALVNEALARRYFGSNEKALNREIEILYLGTPLTFQIVGVVGDTKRESLAETTPPSIYLAESQVPWYTASVVARTKSDANEYAKPIQKVLNDLAGDEDLYLKQTLDEGIMKSVAQPRFYSILFASFAGIAVILACVGLYGVISYVTAQRTQEIGIRMALGAQKRDILKMVLGQGMLLVGIGIVIGIVGALGATRFMESFLYSVGTKDLLSYMAVSLLLAAVALFACFIPARRASKADPLVALRYD